MLKMSAPVKDSRVQHYHLSYPKRKNHFAVGSLISTTERRALDFIR